MKQNRAWIIGAFAAIGLMGASACNHTPEQRATWITKRISSQLDLTPAQDQKLVAVKDTILDARKRHEADRKATHEEMKQILLSDKLDATRVKAAFQKRQATMDQEFDGVFAKVAEFHASLSPKQKQEAVEMLEKLHEKFGD